MSTVRNRKTRRFWRVTAGYVALHIAVVTTLASGAVKERFYPFGEADAGATIGGFAVSTEDILDSASDGQGPFVTLEALSEDEAPTYATGRDGDGSFALEFDGADDLLSSPSFDPRNFGGSFTALSQGWVLPNPDAEGLDQYVWSLGSDNGGVGITSDGFWEMRSVTIVPDTVTDAAVDFGAWTHVAVLRTGGSANLFINGARVARLEGFWNGVGDVSVGAGSGGENPFGGLIDDFNLAGFSDGTFDLVNDLDFFDPDNFSGVLGDVDQDGLVNQADYLIWSASVGFDNEQGAGDVTTLLLGDVNQDGRVTYFDFQIISDEALAAGVPLNLVAVPEPTSIVLVVMGCLLVWTPLRRRRR